MATLMSYQGRRRISVGGYKSKKRHMRTKKIYMWRCSSCGRTGYTKSFYSTIIGVPYCLCDETRIGRLKFWFKEMRLIFISMKSFQKWLLKTQTNEIFQMQKCKYFDE